MLKLTLDRAGEKKIANVQKEWKDGDNRDNLRPGSIQVQLRWRFKGEAERNLVDNTTLKIPGDYIQTLSPATEWDADFENLPIQYNHREVEYSVVEVGVPDEYTVPMEPRTRWIPS